jgi:formylglycine-generating enzyme required for sulfatase activity
MPRTGLRLLPLALLVPLSALTVQPPGQSAPAPPLRNDFTNSIGIKLVKVPAGTFKMGSPRDEMHRQEGELQHEVEITRPFFLGVHEVTQGQYQKVMG